MHLFRLLPAIFLSAFQTMAQTSFNDPVSADLSIPMQSDQGALSRQAYFSQWSSDTNKTKISFQIAASGGSTLTEYTHRHCFGTDSGMGLFYGMTEHPTADAGFSLGVLIHKNGNLRISTGIDYTGYRSYNTTDPAMINDHKLSIGFEPDPQFENTRVYNITGNRISLTAGVEYIFLKKIVVGLNVMHHTFFSPHVRRELYSGEIIAENFPLSFKPSLPIYIPFYYWRMSYEWVLGAEFGINKTKSVLLRPELFCQTRGLYFIQWPYVSLAGIRASLVFKGK